MLENPSDVDTPISVALQIEIFQQSDNPERKAIGDLYNALSEVRSQLQTLVNRQVP